MKGKLKLEVMNEYQMVNINGGKHPGNEKSIKNLILLEKVVDEWFWFRRRRFNIRP